MAVDFASPILPSCRLALGPERVPDPREAKQRVADDEDRQHLNLSCPNLGVQEQPYRPGTFLTDVVPVQPEWEDGHLLPPTLPGLGMDFDREAATGRPFRRVELPHLRRPDGSVTNW